MSLIEKIRKDAVEAGKQGNDLEVDILKLLVAALQNAAIAKVGEELTEEEELKVIFSEANKVKDAIEQFDKGDRADLAEREKKQLPIIARYLPKQADDAEIEALVQRIISELGASGLGNSGMVMGAAMKELQGKADGKRVSEIVKELLS